MKSFAKTFQPTVSLAPLALASALAVGLMVSFWVARPVWIDAMVLVNMAVVLICTGLPITFPRRLIWPVVVFLTAAVLSTSLSVDADRSTRALTWLVGYVATGWLLTMLLASGFAHKTLWRIWQWLALIVFVIAILPWALAGFPLFGWRLMYETNNAMTLYNMLLLGSIATGTLGAHVVLPAAFVAWFSASRGGWAGVLAGAAVLVRDWKALVRRHWPLLIVAALALFIVIIALDLPHRAGRWYIWQVAVEMWRARPLFGAGLDTFQGYWLAAPRGDPNEYGHAHSIIMDVLSQMGVAGLAAWGWLMAVIGRELWARRATAWGRAALAGSVALGVQSLADTPTSQTYIMVTWLALLACAFVEEAHDE